MAFPPIYFWFQRQLRLEANAVQSRADPTRLPNATMMICQLLFVGESRQSAVESSLRRGYVNSHQFWKNQTDMLSTFSKMPGNDVYKVPPIKKFTCVTKTISPIVSLLHF